MISTAMLQQPLFLVGSERSGTTLLRLMLSSHPQLAWNEEFEYVVDFMPAEHGWPLIDAYHRYLAHDFVFASSKFTIDTALSYPQLVNSFLLQRLACDRKPIAGATIHRYFSRLLRVWPGPRFAHLIRAGRAAARSIVGVASAGNPYT